MKSQILNHYLKTQIIEKLKHDKQLNIKLPCSIEEITMSEKDAQGRTDTYYRGRVRVDQGAKANDPKLAALELRPGMTALAAVSTLASRLGLAYNGPAPRHARWPRSV